MIITNDIKSKKLSDLKIGQRGKIISINVKARRRRRGSLPEHIL